MASENNATDRPALDREAHAWLCRLNTGRATGWDARQLEQWCARSPEHRQALARARQAWREMEPAGDLYQLMFPGHRAETLSSGRSVADPRRRRFLGAALATAGTAAIAVAVVRPPLGMWPSWSEMAADHRTSIGEQAHVTVSRDVELILNTQTSLDVQVGAVVGGGDRIRLISGEAAVRKREEARTVELIAGTGRIVLSVGSVGVRRSEGRYCVTCTQGEARVQHPQRNLVLRAGERVWYDANRLESVALINLEQAQAWHQGMVVFRATPLSEAVAEINRYRSGRVMLMNDELASQRLSGQFRIGALDEAVIQIQQIFGATVTQLPAGVVVLS